MKSDRGPKWTPILSSSNERFRSWRGLLASSGIRKQGEALISGEKILRELATLDTDQVEILAWVVREREAENFETYLRDQEISTPDVPRYALAHELFEELNEANTPGPIAIIRRPQLKPADLAKAPNGLELVLCLQDPTNLGAALRVAEAFQASSVILLKECAEPFLMKSLRAASGSAFRLALKQGPSLKELGTFVDEQWLTLDLEGEDIRDAKFKKSARLFLGVEGPGVPEDVRQSSAQKIRIPIAEGMDSLNAVSALSIACYAFRVKNR